MSGKDGQDARHLATGNRSRVSSMHNSADKMASMQLQIKGQTCRVEVLVHQYRKWQKSIDVNRDIDLIHSDTSSKLDPCWSVVHTPVVGKGIGLDLQALSSITPRITLLQAPLQFTSSTLQFCVTTCHEVRISKSLCPLACRQCIAIYCFYLLLICVPSANIYMSDGYLIFLQSVSMPPDIAWLGLKIWTPCDLWIVAMSKTKG